METVQQNGRFTLFSSKFLSIYSFLYGYGQGLLKNVKFFIFWTNSKSRAQELSNDVSFVIFGHETWDLEGGGQIDPPQHILVLSTPAGIGLKVIVVYRLCQSINERLHEIKFTVSLMTSIWL